MDEQLLAVRRRLTGESAKLLDRCALALDRAGLLDTLLEQLQMLDAHGLTAHSVQGGSPVHTWTPMAEVLLYEYLAIAGYDAMQASQQRWLMIRAAVWAGFACES